MRTALLVALVAAGCGPAPSALDGGFDAEPPRLRQCGDGRIEGFERCDDGNRVSGDGCDLDCRRVETGYSCDGEPSVCRITCGDGVVDGRDACDDGNRVSGDGCSSDCREVEPRFECVGEPSRCTSLVVCGDGRLGGEERCDDGNTVDGDGCDASCELELGFVCREEPSLCVARSRCGDGHREATEDCDDGNTAGGDGCSAECRCEAGPDTDNDGVPDACDRCEGDDARLDGDRDGRCGADDDCPTFFDPNPADFDGDGRSDACDLVDTAGTREVRLGDLGLADAADDGVSALAFGDFDGDGIADLAAATVAGRVGWTRGTGDAEQLPIDSGASLFDGGPTSLAFGDVDGDAIEDLVLLDAAAGALYLRFGDTVEPGVRSSADSAVVLGCGVSFRPGLAVADLDADGFAERLVVGEDAGGQPSLCVIDGATGAATVVMLDTEASDEAGAAIAVGDLDGDGVLDVAVADPGFDATGAVELFVGALDPELTLTSAGRRDAGVVDTPREDSRFGAALSIGDLDGDGTDDLVIGEPGHDNGAGRIVRYGDVFGESWADTLGRVDASPGDGLGRAVLAADLDGDGRAEAVGGAPSRTTLGAARAGAVAVRSGGRESARDRDLDAETLLLLAATGEGLGGALAAADLDGDGASELYASWPGRADAAALGVRGNGPLRLGPIAAPSGGSDRSIGVQLRSAGRIAVALERDGEPEIHDAGFISAGADHFVRVDVPWPEEVGDVPYRVLFDGREVARSALRAPERSPTRVRVAVAADLAHYFRPFRPFAHTDSVDAMLLIGDLMYADFVPQLPPEEEAYGERLRLLYGDPHARAAFARRPLATMWDDHEVWNDFWPGHPIYAGYYGPARAAFDRYAAAHNPAPNAVGALHFRFQMSGVSFFVLDNRSHRSPSPDPDGPLKTMIGGEQLASLVQWLGDTSWEIGVLVSSVPMHEQTDTGLDAWFPSYARERDAIFDLIGESGREVHIMSGDHHWAGMFEHELGDGVVVREVMTGPIAVDNRPPPAGPITCLDGTHRVFTVLDVDVSSRVIDASYIDADTGETLCESSFGPVFP